MSTKRQRVSVIPAAWPSGEGALAQFLQEWRASAAPNTQMREQQCISAFRDLMEDVQKGGVLLGPEDLPDLCVRFLRERVPGFIPFVASEMACARRLVRRLTRWLAGRGLAARRDPVMELHDPSREKALKILRKASRYSIVPGPFERQEYIQGLFWVAAVSPEGIWLEALDREDSPIGPIAIDGEALALFRDDWGVWCSICRTDDGWCLCRIDEIIGEQPIAPPKSNPRSGDGSKE